jgi:putative transposase
VVEACADLTAGYADGSLSDELRQAIDDSNHRLTATRRGTVSARSLTRWQTQKKATGHCLPAKTRSKVSWDSAWWMPMLLACYRQPQKPKLTEAMQAFSDDWIRHGFNVADLPSYGIVDRLLKRMPPILRETGRSTGSELAALKPFIRRDWSGASNEVWVGDGHSFKAKVRHPRTGQAFAPEVTVIIDAASRFIVGWAFSLSENQIAVSEALGQGMLKHGKPLIYYSDNGSGQTAKTIDCPAGGMLARLGVTHETGRPGNPQGRGIIEGLWDITAIAAAKTFPTFQGTGMDSGALRKVTNLINSAKSKGEVPAFVPTWERFMATVEEYIDSYNHTHSHSSLGGKTPAEVYYAGFDATWSCPLTEDEALTLYRPFIIRTVVRGEVKWINNVYFNRELSELPLKTKVQVHYDLHHADKVWISDLAGKPICIALWDGNKRDGFAKSKRDLIRDVRIDGIVKLAEQKVAAALAEREDANIIEGEVLVRVPVPMVEPEAELVRVTAPVQPQEETLKRVPSPPTLPEEPLNTVLLEGKFNRQQPEEEAPMRTHAETAAWIDAMLEQRRQSQ